MTQPFDDSAAANEYYNRAFDGVSVGIEEELSGAAVKMPRGAGQLIGVVSSSEGDPLVLITKDLYVGDAPDGEPKYTIELRTTPAVIGSDTWEWMERRRARQVAISAIQRAKNKALETETWGGYKIKILNPNHVVCQLPDSGTITGADRQSTVGVRAADIGAHVSPEERSIGTLHQYVRLPWYNDALRNDPATSDFDEREKTGYALVISAILKLVTLPHPRDGEGHLDTTALLPVNNTEAKNAWKVRPRTPPVKIFDTFTKGHKLTAIEALNKLAMPENVKSLTPKKWSAARAVMIVAQTLGGHPPPDATISDEPAMLFEYRTAPVEDYPYAFWKSGEYEIKQYSEDDD